MGYVLGCLMAGLGFLLNKLLLRCIGLTTVLYYSPILEEALKTVPAYFLGADIFITHSVFGILEGLYDFAASQKNKFRPLFFSTLGHSLFGVITVLGRYFTGQIWLGLAGGVCAHIIWNITVIRLMAKD